MEGCHVCPRLSNVTREGSQLCVKYDAFFFCFPLFINIFLACWTRRSCFKEHIFLVFFTTTGFLAPYFTTETCTCFYFQPKKTVSASYFFVKRENSGHWMFWSTPIRLSWNWCFGHWIKLSVYWNDRSSRLCMLYIFIRAIYTVHFDGVENGQSKEPFS